jgi:predicted transcriptional regulator
MKILSIFNKLTDELSQGLSPSFNEAHVLKTFEILGEKDVGRKQLSEKLGVGEGVVRNIINRFKANSLAATSKKGTVLTEKGMSILKKIKVRIRSAIIPSTQITVESCNYAVLVRGKADSIYFGMEQRDHALLAGASGATTIVFRDDGVRMPGREMEIEPDISDSIMKKLNPVDGDVIIIGSSDTMLSAEIGAKAAALKLLWSIGPE